MTSLRETDCPTKSLLFFTNRPACAKDFIGSLNQHALSPVPAETNMQRRRGRGELAQSGPKARDLCKRFMYNNNTRRSKQARVPKECSMRISQSPCYWGSYLYIKIIIFKYSYICILLHAWSSQTETPASVYNEMKEIKNKIKKERRRKYILSSWVYFTRSKQVVHYPKRAGKTNTCRTISSKRRKMPS